MATPTTLPASFVSGAVLTAAQMNNLRGAFRVLQVVQDIKTDTFTTTSTTFVDITGLSVTITPSSTTSQVLIIANLAYGLPFSAGCFYRIAGGNATTYVGDAGGSRVRSSFGGFFDTNGSNHQVGASIVYLDSPATTSATTYRVQAAVPTGNTAFVNRGGNDSDDARFARSASSIIVMEISA